MKSLLRIVGAVVVGVLIWSAITRYVGEPIFIPTPSMEPTLPVGIHVWLDKRAFKKKPPERGDIIVFRSPDGKEIEMVKRVIAIPGDIIEMRAKKVILNGALQDEPYVQYTRATERLKGDTMAELRVSDRSVFVLGDNRDESLDSSSWKDPETGESIELVPYSMIRGLVRGFYRRYDDADTPAKK